MSGTEQIDLEQLLAERKEEQRKALKERLKNQVKTIHDRKLLELNNEPFPEGAFEVLQSNRVWEKVLEYLTDPSDVTSAYFSCRTFAVILDERRNLMMLQKALDALRTSADKASKARNWRIWEARYHTWKAICLKCRQVGKAWKDSADFELFDSNFTKKDWILNTADWLETEYPRSKVCVFRNEKDVDRATSLLENLQSPSRIVRKLSIILPDYVVITEQFFPKVIKFLEMHGTSVWSLYFHYDNPANMADLYEVLCDMLELMPNLRGLALCLFTSHITRGLGLWRLGEEALGFGEFKRRLNERPFPILNSLEHFRSCATDTDENLLSQIFRNCVNLRSASYSEEQLGVNDEVEEALKELSLERYCGCGRIVMSNSNQLPWNLKHLTIQMHMLGVKASELFPVLHRFRDTLQHLCIYQMVQMDKTNHDRLDLPHLKSLHCIHNGAIAFDDILLLQSLEEIIMDSLGYEDKNGKVKVKSYLDSKEMGKSNVWKWFPNLKRLRLPGWVNFFRNDYEWFV